MPQPPWEKSSAKQGGKTKLSEKNLAWARARARKAGRRYPNLIDNMAATRRQVEQELRAKGPGFLRKL